MAQPHFIMTINSPLLYSDTVIDPDELSHIVTLIEDALEDIPPSKQVVACLTLAIYLQKPDMDMQSLADLAFDTSKFIVAQLVGDGLSPTEMN